MQRILAALLLSFLSACATQRALQPTDIDESGEKWQTRIQQLAPLDHWSIRGRVAIFIDQEVHNAGLSWHRKASDSKLTLEAFLNQGSILVKKNATGVRLTAASGEQYTGHNAQQLLHQVTGLMLPVDDLQTWIKGLPHQDSAYQHSIDNQGRAIIIKQDGWTINYLEYQSVAWSPYKNAELPRRLYLKHDDLALKVVIDQWQDKTLPGNSEIFPEFNRSLPQ